jgi:hypothetical protein
MQAVHRGNYGEVKDIFGGSARNERRLAALGSVCWPRTTMPTGRRRLRQEKQRSGVSCGCRAGLYEYGPMAVRWVSPSPRK